MFDIGDYIVYGSNGICKVEDITHPDIAGPDKKALYYVLIPEKTKASRLFCPTDNQRVVLRKIVSAEEAKKLLADISELEPLTVPSERLRDETYKQVTKSCDLRQGIQMMKALALRKKEREACGKKATATDERYMKLVEEGLTMELSIAMGMDVEEVRQKIEAGIEIS